MIVRTKASLWMQELAARRRERHPYGGVTTKEKSVTWMSIKDANRRAVGMSTTNPTACMNDKVRTDIEAVAENIARALLGIKQLPEWSVATAALHFVPNEDDRAAIIRTSALCQSHIPESQKVNHLMSVQPGYRIKLSYTYQSKQPIFLFPTDADISPEMQSTDEYQLLVEYADHWYEADRRATHFKALALYLAFACPSINQLKTVWPEFDTVFAKSEYVGQFDKATSVWVERFRKAPVGKLPHLFPGFQEEIAEAQRTVGMYLVLDKPEGYVTNLGMVRACPIAGPVVPWWDHVDPALKENTTVPKQYRWCL